MSQSTKAKIARSAESLFLTQGYEAASLNDLVARAGVSKGAFFHYYPNKQAIIIDILDSYAQTQLLTPLDKHMSGARTLKSGLLAWLEEGYSAAANGKFKGGCLLGNFALELSDRDEAVREHIKQLFLQWENQFVGYFKPAQAEGKLLMEPRQFARLIIAMMEGITMMGKVHKDHIRASREFQALAELIERMVKD